MFFVNNILANFHQCCLPLFPLTYAIYLAVQFSFLAILYYDDGKETFLLLGVSNLCIAVACLSIFAVIM